MKQTLLLALALLALAGCAGGVQKDAYDVYYINQALDGRGALVAEARALPQEGEEVEGLVSLLLTPPQEEGLRRAIPEGVTLLGWSLSNGLLTVDLSEGYGALSGIDLTLADYSLTLTLAQAEGVETVMITVEGEMLPYRDRQRLSPDEAWWALEELEEPAG